MWVSTWLWYLPGGVVFTGGPNISSDHGKNMAQALAREPS
jgi:hypothetical protein